MGDPELEGVPVPTLILNGDFESLLEFIILPSSFCSILFGRMMGAESLEEGGVNHVRFATSDAR